MSNYNVENCPAETNMNFLLKIIQCVKEKIYRVVWCSFIILSVIDKVRF